MVSSRPAKVVLQFWELSSSDGLGVTLPGWEGDSMGFVNLVCMPLNAIEHFYRKVIGLVLAEKLALFFHESFDNLWMLRRNVGRLSNVLDEVEQ